MYAIVWAYRVRPRSGADFERHYGPEGTWAAFFRSGRGYLRTELLRDRRDPQRYCTIDLWESATDYETFTAARAEEYTAIDDRCGEMTESEECLGRFDVV